MTRRTFLTFLAALLPLRAAPAVSKKAWVLNRCHVAGLQYHPGIALRLRSGDALKMVREPENPYDANAVALYVRGIKLGYVPKKENMTLALLLDQNAPLYAKVDRFDVEARSWERVKIVVEQVG